MMEEQFEIEEIDENEEALSSEDTRDKGLIKSSITVHDQTQVETIFDYSIRPKKLASARPQQKTYRSKTFEVEAYIILPQQVGINSEEYLRSHFYNDLRPLLRLKEPRFSYREFLATHEKKRPSPLQQVLRLIERIETRQEVSESELSEAINVVRVHAAAYSSYLIKRVNRSVRLMQHLVEKKHSLNAASIKHRVDSVVQKASLLLERAYHLRQIWWLAISRLRNLESKNAKIVALIEEMQLAEEYCHYRFCSGVSRLIYETDLLQREGIHAEQLQNFSHKLRVWVRLQRRIAHGRSYGWLDADIDIEAKEQYLFRKNLLKKRMWQVFYLSIKPRSSFVLQRQVTYMAAAAFAAAWAFGANIMIWQQLQEKHLSSIYDWPSLVNYSGFFLALAFILVYTFQDRIKEWARSKFRRGIFGKLPDLSEKIWAKNVDGERHCIGIMQESVDFLEATSLPQDIRTMRSKLPPIDMTGKEKIILYRKTITLDAKTFEKIYHSVHVVRDIVRFNVSRFLSKLDDPLQETLCFRKDGNVELIPIPKIYHLDMLLRYSSKHPGEKMQQITINYNRLAFNKNGLIRIEEEEEEAFRRRNNTKDLLAFIDRW